MPSSDKLKSHKADSAPAKKQPKEGAAPNASVALEGKKAPNFELPDESGKAVRLKDLIGSKALVLYFYPKDMTPGCTMQACSFRDNESKLRAAGARVVGISGDSSASHTKFIEKQSLNFPLLADPSHKVSTAYGVYKMKSLYGREYMGIERTTFVIDKTGLVRKVFPKVKVNGHSDEVLAALKELH